MDEQINGMVETIQQLEKENADLKLRIAAVMQRSEQLSDFERWAKLNAKNMHDIDYWIAEYRYQKSLNCA
jgi:rhamnose utilization protein RhaD (predicted bifunctional aldolase and dehydrogenase)